MTAFAMFVGLTMVVGATDPACQDTNAIKWYLPGQFKEARKAAEKQNRILMIKGIAFGIDEAGAKCATKGCW